MTKQRVRDLNHYGPRPDKGATGAPEAAPVGEAKAEGEASPAVTAPPGTNDGGEPQ